VRTALVIAQERETSRFCSHNQAGLRVAQRAQDGSPRRSCTAVDRRKGVGRLLPSSRAPNWSSRPTLFGMHRSIGGINERTTKKVLICRIPIHSGDRALSAMGAVMGLRCRRGGPPVSDRGPALKGIPGFSCRLAFPPPLPVHPVLELEHLIGFQHCNRRAIGIGGIEGKEICG
jgi:hypothetical protein